MEKSFSLFLSAYRKNYSSQNILISLIEEWRKNLGINFVVGAVLTDLSKDFDCKPHDLLMAKLSAYNFSDEALPYIYSCLTNRQLETIILGVTQGSILGPILLNLSINDLFFFVALASLYNFLDDNTLYAFATTVSRLIQILGSESKMVVNADKLQEIMLDKRKTNVLVLIISKLKLFYL